MGTAKLSVTGLAFGILLCAPIAAQVTQRMSVNSAGVQGNGDSAVTGIGPGMSMSADGRYVAFDSNATNLVPGDTNNATDVFVRDRQTGTTERVSVTPRGWPASGDSFFPSISADGRFVAFTSEAPDLVPGDTNSTLDVFVRDRQAGTTERVSVTSAGVQGNSYSNSPSISADGRFVAFESRSRLALQDSNTWEDIYVHDCLTGATEFVSMSSAGTPADAQCSDPSISGDGRYVAFWTAAHDLVAVDNDGWVDTFVRDRQTGTTEIVSLSSAGANTSLTADWPSISADGRYVAFTSESGNLVPGDTNGTWDVFLRDRQNLTTERVSLATGGAQGIGDRGFGSPPSISADGRYVAFDADATNLVPGDTNGSRDIFVRDRDATGFTSSCDPGVAGVLACPCSNSATGSGRGCDNSAATGGASLSAAGVAYLSSESLVFTTSGEKPTALSILLQGNASLANGVIYGQGVRCAGGSLKRLFVKTAVAGSITAPDFGAGDPTISARSAAKGDVIQAGQSRWYLVYYRDPIVLGGCPAGNTFNATQTGQVSWSM